MHKYSVSLAIRGDEMVEADVSRMLDLQCSVFQKKDELCSPTTRYDESAWLRHFEPSDESPTWLSLEDGLSRLTEELQPRKSALNELKKRYAIEAYCGHFGSGFGGGPTISPETLRAIGELGLMLRIRTYWKDVGPE